MLSFQTLLASAAALLAANAQTTAGPATPLCTASGNSSGLVNSDSNVAFVDGYYGFADPTIASAGGVNAIPWAYPMDKCTMVLASDTKPYWKFTCMNDGEYVLAENFNDDYTCMGTVVESKTIGMTNDSDVDFLAFNCGSGTTEAWFRTQMFIATCQEDTPEDQLNTYGVVGQEICEATLLPAANGESAIGFANFYCDMNGLSLSSYEFTASACAGDLCGQTTVAYEECDFLIGATVGDAVLEVYTKPLECMSAEYTGGADGGDDDDHATGAAATMAVALSAVVAVLFA